MKARYFFAASAIALIVAVGFLIYHQRTANDMARQVEQADLAAFSLIDTTKAYAAAERYTKSHMGVTVSIEMMGEYKRQLSLAQAGQGTQANPQVYAAAQAACGMRDSVSQSRCISTYVNNNSAPGANPQPTEIPQRASFTKTFRGASWTLDGTGVALVLSIMAAAWGFVLLTHNPSRSRKDPSQHRRGPRPNVRL